MLLLATTTGYQTRAFGEAAERAGVELVFATDRCDRLEDPWQDRAIPIRFHDEDRAVARIVAVSRSRPLHGLLVVGDRPTTIAARAAEALGLPWHPPEGARLARHKQLTRERLREAGLPVPWFHTFTVNDDAAAVVRGGADRQPIAWPCVVKPLALSGSRGVIRADDPESFAAAVARVKSILRAPDVQAERSVAHRSILVEGFLPGREFAVEALMDRGVFHLLAIFDKPDPLDGPYFEETIYVTPSAASPAEHAAIAGAVRNAAAALGLRHGPIHAECRVNADGVYVLEVAARPIGGLCARALQFDSSGRSPARASLEEVLLRHAIGERVEGWRRERDASGVMMIPIPRRGMLRGVDRVDEARSVPHIVDLRITAKMDQQLVPLPEGASYLGFIFARAPRPDDVVAALRAAHARLTFRIDAELPIVGAEQMHYNHAHG